MESSKTKTRALIRKDSILTKIGILSAILLLSSIPRFFVESTIEERKETRAEAVRSVTQGWAARQVFGRFEVLIPYQYVADVEMPNPVNPLHHLLVKKTQVEQFVVRPEVIDVRIESSFETRKRGIFEIPVFTSDIVMKGRVRIPKEANWPLSERKVLWDEASLRAGFTNPETLQDFSLMVDGAALAMKRASESLEFAGFKSSSLRFDGSFEFELRMRAVGIEGISIFPVADEAHIHVKGAWPDPSFRGQLPANYEITDTSYAAQWKLSKPVTTQAIEVSFIEEADVYQQSLRAVKYGLFITLLTLTVFFLFEILAGWRLHVMHYVFLTLPLSVYYVLLIAFSEHIGFFAAYVLASLAVVGLMGAYLKGRDPKGTRALMGILGFVYTLVYGLLVSSDYALLVGSLALFAALAAVMLLTRKVDWGRGLSDADDTSKDSSC